MNILNSIFPFLGTFISYIFMLPLFNALGQSWQHALGIWGIGIIVIWMLWLLFIREKDIASATILCVQENSSEEQTSNIYNNLLHRKEIILLTIIFMCDFFVYSYITVMLPTFLYESSSMNEATASLWAAIAFPASGLVGCIWGGWFAARCGRRKLVLLLGVGLELTGVMLVGLLSPYSFVLSIMGFAMFGFGNGVWLPALYNIPMELPDMTPTLVGASFALMSSCAFACGFISPTVGGWITDLLVKSSSLTDSVLAHVYGLRWSLFIFGFINLLGLICAVLIKETGPGRAHR